MKHRSKVIAWGCEDVYLPERVLADGGVMLTSRESDVAGSAAQDLSRKEIGERLFLSLRTVDIHPSGVSEARDQQSRGTPRRQVSVIVFAVPLVRRHFEDTRGHHLAISAEHGCDRSVS